jgi:hypothetical protein
VPEWLVKSLVARRLWTGRGKLNVIEPEPESLENAETTTTSHRRHGDARSIRSEARSDVGSTRRRKHKKRESDRDGSHEDRHRSRSSPPASESGETQAAASAIFVSSDQALLPGIPQSTVSAVVDWQLQNHKGFVPAFISSIRYGPVHNQHHRWAIIKQNIENGTGPLKEVWLVLGETDPIINKDELIDDATDVLGEENVSFRVVEGAGHEVAIERADEIVQVVGSVLGWHKKPKSVRSTHKRRGLF